MSFRNSIYTSRLHRTNPVIEVDSFRLNANPPRIVGLTAKAWSRAIISRTDGPYLWHEARTL